MNAVNHTTLPYFERLPRYALPALQASWDQANGRAFGTLAIYNGFCRSMKEVGFDAPLKPEFSQWIADVQAGNIPRPGRTTPAEEEASSPVAAPEVPVEDVPDAAELRALRSKPFFTPAFPAETPVEFIDETVSARALSSMRAVRDQMVSDLVEQLQANARVHAEAVVISALRDVAAEMERASR